jgi:hypothetical protein
MIIGVCEYKIIHKNQSLRLDFIQVDQSKKIEEFNLILKYG